MCRFRWLLALLAAACVWLPLGLLVTDLKRRPSSTSGPSAARTIVAYSLRRQLQQQQRQPVQCASAPEKGRSQQRPWPSPRSNPGLYLFSAYHDRRVPRFHYVRVLAMAAGTVPASIYCQLWYAHHPPVVVEAVTMEMWLSHWDTQAGDSVDRPLLLSCPIPESVSSSRNGPDSVSLAMQPCSSHETLLNISGGGGGGGAGVGGGKDDFAVCVKGMDFPDHDVSVRLVEWLELNALLGAAHFFVYVYRVHPNTWRVLRDYAARGVATVVPVTLPGTQPNEARARTRFLRTHVWQKRRDELIPYNDCLYRSLDAYHYVVPVDVDEVIIPLKDDTWKQLFRQLRTSSPDIMDRYSSFSVRNAYFLDVFPVSGGGPWPPFLHTMTHTTRSAHLSPPDEALKSFVATAASLTVFNHHTLQPLSPATRRNLVLATSLVQLHHYRPRCPARTTPACRRYLHHRVVDTAASRYGRRLLARVWPVLRRLRLLT